MREELERLFELHDEPNVLRSDDGRDFIATSLRAWRRKQGVEPAYIEKGKPAAKPLRGALQGHPPRR